MLRSMVGRMHDARSWRLCLARVSRCTRCLSIQTIRCGSKYHRFWNTAIFIRLHASTNSSYKSYTCCWPHIHLGTPRHSRLKRLHVTNSLSISLGNPLLRSQISMNIDMQAKQNKPRSSGDGFQWWIRGEYISRSASPLLALLLACGASRELNKLSALLLVYGYTYIHIHR